jgi:DNA relaxase NicK
MSIYKTDSKPAVKPNPVVVAGTSKAWAQWTKADWTTWAERRLAGKAVWIDAPEAQAAWDALVQPDVKKPVPNLVNTADTSGMKPSHFSEAHKTNASAKPIPQEGKRHVIQLTDNDPLAAIQPDGIQVTMIDWFRVTTNELDSFKATLTELEGDSGILENANLDVKWKQKGMHGYTDSASILLWKDNDYMTVGNLAYSEDGRNKGGMLELTGTGCKVLQVEYPALWLELYNLLTYYNWRISRVDIALDLSGAYCQAHGFTVPKLMREAKRNDLFKSDAAKNPTMKAAIEPCGDWSDMTIGELSVDDYDPLAHCPAGLTMYVGKRKSSDDFFRVYEKGKEILGKQAEPEAVDRAWIRIEHEMSRKASGRIIPLDAMIRPDEYFCAGRSNIRAVMEAVRNDRELKAIQCWQREQFKREKSLMLSRKVHWARHTYGRTIHTMRGLGWTDEQIVDALMRESGLKEFIPDLLDHAPDEGDVLDDLLDHYES